MVIDTIRKMDKLIIPPEFVFFGTRILVALLIGLIMGAERTLGNHSSGIKTFVFVSVGSCLFSSLSFYLKDIFPTSDPTRILGQIISAVGFLGAGVIFHSNDKTVGLTTSAIILTLTSLGIMVGSGLFLIPVSAAVFLVVVIIFLRWFERILTKKFGKFKTNQNE